MHPCLCNEENVNIMINNIVLNLMGFSLNGLKINKCTAYLIWEFKITLIIWKTWESWQNSVCMLAIFVYWNWTAYIGPMSMIGICIFIAYILVWQMRPRVLINFSNVILWNIIAVLVCIRPLRCLVLMCIRPLQCMLSPKLIGTCVER